MRNQRRNFKEIATFNYLMLIKKMENLDIYNLQLGQPYCYGIYKSCGFHSRLMAIGEITFTKRNRVWVYYQKDGKEIRQSIKDWCYRFFLPDSETISKLKEEVLHNCALEQFVDFMYLFNRKDAYPINKETYPIFRKFLDDIEHHKKTTFN